MAVVGKALMLAVKVPDGDLTSIFSMIPYGLSLLRWQDVVFAMDDLQLFSPPPPYFLLMNFANVLERYIVTAISSSST